MMGLRCTTSLMPHVKENLHLLAHFGQNRHKTGKLEMLYRWLSCQVVCADYWKRKLIVSSLICTPLQQLQYCRLVEGARLLRDNEGKKKVMDLATRLFWAQWELWLQASSVISENMDFSPEPWGWLSSKINKWNERVTEKNREWKKWARKIWQIHTHTSVRIKVLCTLLKRPWSDKCLTCGGLCSCCVYISGFCACVHLPFSPSLCGAGHEWRRCRRGAFCFWGSWCWGHHQPSAA